MTLICRVTGNPKPILSWRVRDRTLWPEKSKTSVSTEKPENPKLLKNKVFDIRLNMINVIPTIIAPFLYSLF